MCLWRRKKMILKEINTKENNIIYTEVQIFFNLKYLFTKILISNLTMDWSWCRTGTLWFFFTEKLRQVSIFCYYACQYLLIIYCIETLIFMNRTTFSNCLRWCSLNTIYFIINRYIQMVRTQVLATY